MQRTGICSHSSCLRAQTCEKTSGAEILPDAFAFFSLSSGQSALKSEQTSRLA
jgi:hypothetical protein